MIFIAHRGNFEGSDPNKENTIAYMKAAYDEGYGVECDIQLHDGKLYFGHDGPQELVDYEFISRDNVFCHAKTVETFSRLMNLNINCFWHESDQVTLTSEGQIWCYPGIHPLHSQAIWLDLLGRPLPDRVDIPIYGVCGDDLKGYLNLSSR